MINTSNSIPWPGARPEDHTDWVASARRLETIRNSMIRYGDDYYAEALRRRDDRDLSHLYPDRVLLGGPAVFAGDWAWTPNEHGELRIPVGFVGTLVDTWNGWAVFTCTREVAEAIVADQHDARDRYRQQLAADGIAGERQEQMVDQSLARLRFDGDVIVADETRVQDDPEAIERITPDAEGRYTVMGRAWTWMAVHPYDCERIVGDLPGLPATVAT